MEARQHGWNIADLASHARLYNYFVKSGAAENKIESFIKKVSSGDVSPERVIELVYQLHEISKKESIPLDQLYQAIIRREAKNWWTDKRSIEAINEHIHLKDELKKYGLSTNDIHKLVNLLLAAKEYRYSPGKIVAKLRNIKRLENKENRLKSSCKALSKQANKYKEIIPLADLIHTETH